MTNNNTLSPGKMEELLDDIESRDDSTFKELPDPIANTAQDDPEGAEKELPKQPKNGAFGRPAISDEIAKGLGTTGGAGAGTGAGTETGANGNTNVEQPTDDKVLFNLSELMPPGTAIDLLNLVIPLLVVFLGDKYGNVDIDGKEIEFDAKERKTLEKPLQRAFDETSVGTKNPWVALIIVLIVLLGSKVAVAWLKAREANTEDIEHEDVNTSPKTRSEKAKKRTKSRSKSGSKTPPKKAAPAPAQTDIILYPKNVKV